MLIFDEALHVVFFVGNHSARYGGQKKNTKRYSQTFIDPLTMVKYAAARLFPPLYAHHRAVQPPPPKFSIPQNVHMDGHNVGVTGTTARGQLFPDRPLPALG